MIEYLKDIYWTNEHGQGIASRPNNEHITDKVNEIIEYLNDKDNPYSHLDIEYFKNYMRTFIELDKVNVDEAYESTTEDIFFTDISAEYMTDWHWSNVNEAYEQLKNELK